MDVHIALLGGFSVVRDGAPVPDDAWSRRGAASLVKVLALADGRRLHREQVIDALWPGLPVDAAAPRLHKAAHYARRALGDVPDALILRQDHVVLLADHRVTVDAREFERLGRAAIASASMSEAETALAAYGGPLLPEDPYESWAVDARDRLAARHEDLLRMAGRWEELVRANPLDEEAHLALARQHAQRGDTRAALRQLERMDQALRRELGTVPSDAMRRLRAELTQAEQLAPAEPSAHTLVARDDVDAYLRERLDLADSGRGASVMVTGVAGVGKSSVLDLLATHAARRGWRVARGGAAAVEGCWPYAPVLEAFADLCRRHPALLDGLDDAYSDELGRALAGRDITWTGEAAHQRLFVAAAELLRLAAAGHGLLLLVDDVHEADEASLRLLHYLARCAVGEPVVVALGARPEGGPALREIGQSLVARGIGSVVELTPLDEASTRKLVAERFPELAPGLADEIWAVSGGLPFRILEAARSALSGDRDVAVSGLPPHALAVMRRVALLGSAFSTDELLAVAGTSEVEAYESLEAALTTSVVEPAESGYRFRHALVRDAALATFSPLDRSREGRLVAEQLAAIGAPPARVAHLFISSGHPVQAVPYALPAIETAGALGAYRDALALLDAVVDHATGADRAHLLARRGDLLTALADPGAVDAYRVALPVTSGTAHRLVRARLARAATFQGDLDTAEAALSGMEIEGDAADGPMLLSRGNLAYARGDIDTAWQAADAARSLLRADDPWQMVDLISLQGLIAHQRGEWFERFRRELRSAGAAPGLAAAVFDAHLCVAEYLLYGPMPYDEVIELAVQLRRRAEQYGALRGVAFAAALIGEAALLKGDLETAERELRESADLHHEIDASAGEAHCLQRLAEVRLAQGDRDEAVALLRAAEPLARWSVISLHLLQRIHGTFIAAAEDPAGAMVMVEQAEATLAENDRCTFCDVMFAAPATIACAEAGDIDRARGYLAMAERSASYWAGTAWPGAVAEARAHLSAALGEDGEAARWIASAEQLFRTAQQPLDAARCAAYARDLGYAHLV
jgi:DNA-binding SARP family transcriptional activator